MVNPVTALLTATLLIGILGLVFWPESGLFYRWRRSRRATGRVLCEDALKHIYKWEQKNRRPTLESIAGVLQVSLDKAGDLVSMMEAKGLLEMRDGQFHLTADGGGYALHVIRTHRLWERYLAERTGYSQKEWHERAEEYEHRISRSEADRLSAELGNPTHDPHGDPIPTSSGRFVSHGGRPLTTMAPGRLLRIVHLEDEPPTVYAQLVAEGLHPGMTLQVSENSGQRVRFWSDGDEHVLAPILANNISVIEMDREAPAPTRDLGRLGDLLPGQKGRVLGLSPECRGLERRRFMDLGILPGTVVEVQRRSPGGDPTAYRIRGSVIALRRKQADLIQVANSH